MRARDLVQQVPTVSLDTNALEAAALVAAGRLCSLMVLDADGKPVAVVPGSAVVRCVIPHYIDEDANLAWVFADDDGDELARSLSDRTVSDVLEATPGWRDKFTHFEVDAEDSAMEVASTMSHAHLPQAAVLEDGRYLGSITAVTVLNYLLPDDALASASATLNAGDQA